LGGKSKGTTETTLDVKMVWRTNILEGDEEELEMEMGELDISLRPF